jgi:HPr kinase/phosphorylase
MNMHYIHMSKQLTLPFKEIPQFCNQHGTLMVIDNCGVMLLGKSGIGKSLLAFMLLHQGHRLVADDSILLCENQNTLEGRAPLTLFGKLELRGYGIIDIPSVFGYGSLIKKYPIHFAINLIEMTPQSMQEYPRVGWNLTQKLYNGYAVRTICLPIAEFSAMPTLIKTIVHIEQITCNY